MNRQCTVTEQDLMYLRLVKSVLNLTVRDGEDHWDLGNAIYLY